jgi:hypothetical protein
VHGTVEGLRDHYPGKWLLIEFDGSQAEEGTVLAAHENPETHQHCGRGVGIASSPWTTSSFHTISRVPGSLEETHSDSRLRTTLTHMHATGTRLAATVP